jgi:hypothetical protein
MRVPTAIPGAAVHVDLEPRRRRAAGIMVTLRCTRRVLAKLRTTPSSAAVAPTTRLGDWYAGWVPLRSPLVITMNERTLLTVVIAAAPSVTMLERWQAATRTLLLALGVAPADADAELLAMQDVVIGAAANRRVLGCLTEATRVLGHLRTREPAPWERAAMSEPERASLALADMIYSTTAYRPPRDMVREAFGLPLAAPRPGRVH